MARAFLQIVREDLDPLTVEHATIHELCRRVLAQRVARAHQATQRALDAHCEAERARADVVEATDLLFQAALLVERGRK